MAVGQRRDTPYLYKLEERPGLAPFRSRPEDEATARRGLLQPGAKRTGRKVMADTSLYPRSECPVCHHGPWHGIHKGFGARYENPYPTSRYAPLCYCSHTSPEIAAERSEDRVWAPGDWFEWKTAGGMVRSGMVLEPDQTSKLGGNGADVQIDVAPILGAWGRPNPEFWFVDLEGPEFRRLAGCRSAKS